MGSSLLSEVKESFSRELADADGLRSIEEIKVAYLGRKGRLTLFLRELSSLPLEERKDAGREANVLKVEIQEKIDGAKKKLSGDIEKEKLDQKLDLTLPGRVFKRGKRHPISQLIEESFEIFRAYGFSEIDVPELDTDYNNFEALNFSKDHLARDLHDTFYLDDKHLLRTHTSTVQIHAMKQYAPPLRLMTAGKCYRKDTIDATHFPVFHQIDCFVVDREVTFSDLKGLLEYYAAAIMGTGTKSRFRPHYFPFTEPSAEVDFSCTLCDGRGCSVCKGQGWIEIGGAGMINPEIFRHVGYDPHDYQGFAFGLGIERIAMIRAGIDDIRLFYENDIRFLEQF